MSATAITVHFFRPSGKWYTTETMDWLGQEGEPLCKGLMRSLKVALGQRLWGMTAVCVDPAVKNGHPLLVVWNDGWADTV